MNECVKGHKGSTKLYQLPSQNYYFRALPKP